MPEGQIHVHMNTHTHREGGKEREREREGGRKRGRERERERELYSTKINFYASTCIYIIWDIYTILLNYWTSYYTH